MILLTIKIKSPGFSTYTPASSVLVSLAVPVQSAEIPAFQAMSQNALTRSLLKVSEHPLIIPVFGEPYTTPCYWTITYVLLFPTLFLHTEAAKSAPILIDNTISDYKTGSDLGCWTIWRERNRRTFTQKTRLLPTLIIDANTEITRWKQHLQPGSD
ncbi:hypothetical protein FCM35_KLT04018 [Carex littledalei]|uniref:Uncharacterized protein n=1 Tax=Carex littledalei TaxID=544730 RepID=A0A833R7D6_9POAL|nr:hypothetical protein FCM35_KLT04018 [Carex littledalei]